jgi:hypothetical protein|tara:strand:- start:136 stop:453 length:318 start_codon:yes stop_codon:yes gene_type:complete
MKRSRILLASLMAIFVIGAITMVPVVWAYSALGDVGGPTLEEQLILAERKVQKAAENPATGSGTPYLDATGVLGASVIAGAIFGGIATVFFVKGRAGRYAAYGRG